MVMGVGTPPGPHVRIVGEEDLPRVPPYPLRELAVGGGEGGTRGVVEETCRILSIRFLPRRRVSVAPFCGHGLRLDRRSKSPRPPGRPWLRRCAICGRTGCRRLYLFRTFRIFLRSDMKTSVAPTTSRTSFLFVFIFSFLGNKHHRSFRSIPTVLHPRPHRMRNRIGSGLFPSHVLSNPRSKGKGCKPSVWIFLAIDGWRRRSRTWHVVCARVRLGTQRPGEGGGGASKRHLVRITCRGAGREKPGGRRDRRLVDGGV